MIKISIKHQIAPGGEAQFVFRFRGHAGYAPPGSDIVCAAVSTLYDLLAHSEAVRLRQAGAGEALLCLNGPRAETLCPETAAALERLAAAYPAHVWVRIAPRGINAPALSERSCYEPT